MFIVSLQSSYRPRNVRYLSLLGSVVSVESNIRTILSIASIERKEVGVACCEAIFQYFLGGAAEGDRQESKESRFLCRGVLTSTLIFRNPLVNRRLIQGNHTYT